MKIRFLPGHTHEHGVELQVDPTDLEAALEKARRKMAEMPIMRVELEYGLAIDVLARIRDLTLVWRNDQATTRELLVCIHSLAQSALERCVLAKMPFEISAAPLKPESPKRNPFERPS